MKVVDYHNVAYSVVLCALQWETMIVFYSRGLIFSYNSETMPISEEFNKIRQFSWKMWFYSKSRKTRQLLLFSLL